MIFKRKPGPLLRWSRLLHASVAFGVTVAGSHFWGDTGCAFSGAGAIVGGFGWEIANRFTGGWHPFGDVVDFFAFVIGALVAGLLWIVLIPSGIATGP